MKKNYRFVKRGTVTKGDMVDRVKLLIQISKKNEDKYRYILKVNDNVFTGWTVKKFSEENDPNINARNIYMMEGFWQSLIIALYRKQENIDLLEKFAISRGEKIKPLEWTWDYLREDWLNVW